MRLTDESIPEVTFQRGAPAPFPVTLVLVNVEPHRVLHLLLLRPLRRLVRRRQRLLGPRRLHALLPLPRLALGGEKDGRLHAMTLG